MTMDESSNDSPRRPRCAAEWADRIMASSSEWTCGGAHLLDVILDAPTGAANGGYLFERGDGETLAFLRLEPDDNSADALLGQARTATELPGFQVVIIELNSGQSPSFFRVRIVSRGAVRVDSPTTMDQLHARLQRWWLADDSWCRD